MKRIAFAAALCAACLISAPAAAADAMESLNLDTSADLELTDSTNFEMLLTDTGAMARRAPSSGDYVVYAVADSIDIGTELLVDETVTHPIDIATDQADGHASAPAARDLLGHFASG